MYLEIFRATVYNLELFRYIQVNLERANKFQIDLEYGRYIQVNLDQKHLNVPEKMPSYHEICRAPARQTAIYQMLVKFRDDKKIRYIQIYLDIFRIQ